MPERSFIPPIQKVANVQADYLFISDHYQIKDWSFNFKEDDVQSAGYNDCFCFTLVRQGNFLFDYGRKENDMYTGHIIVEKANFEYGLRPASGCCTIFNFSNELYYQLVDDLNLKYSFFFSNPKLLSLLLRTTPETEYLHHQVLSRAEFAGKLEMDNLVFELVKQVVALITDESPDTRMDAALLRYHLCTVEKAKLFMNEYFYNDISLLDISVAAHVSQFHFSRIFKRITQLAPYQYLVAVRLKHAEMLLKNTKMLVAEIAIAAGFNNAEHFATMFRQKYQMSPVEYRKTQKLSSIRDRN